MMLEKDHYMRLLTDMELTDRQSYIWYNLVAGILGSEFAPRFEHFQTENENFPYAYDIILSRDLKTRTAEFIVKAWEKIYPRDFEIESSKEYDSEDCKDCNMEMDDDMHAEVQHRVNKFLHNRWVEDKINEGWRFGLKGNKSGRISPLLRDWDSLHESFRHELILDRKQAIDFYLKHRSLLV